MDASRLKTTGQLAAIHGLKIHQVEYLVDRLAVKPATRAGLYRLYDQRASRIIAEELARRAERRQQRAK